MSGKAYVQPKARPKPEQYDCPLRYHVWSRRDDESKHLVQFDSFDFNGECSCPDFRFNLEKYLRQGLTAEQCVAQGFVKLRPGRSVHDALRCQHIIDALLAFGEKCARVVSNDQKKITTQANH